VLPEGRRGRVDESATSLALPDLHRRVGAPDLALDVAGTFAASVARAGTLPALAALLGAAASDLGFSFFAIAEHANLARPPPDLLLLHNYPPGWADAFMLGGWRHDPAWHAASRHVAGFRWSELPALMRLTDRERAHLAAARRAGLGTGYTVPLHAPGGRAASCSFAVAPRHRIAAHTLLAADIVAQRAFLAASTILGTRSRRPHLSPREHECVVLMAQGKTDWEIARILGLSEETVTRYLKTARQRFGVTRRTQLALAAMNAGLIEMRDCISWA
jgi:LuxR family transcriptional regulator, quorum-sensing system regulator CciR